MRRRDSAGRRDGGEGSAAVGLLAYGEVSPVKLQVVGGAVSSRLCGVAAGGVLETFLVELYRCRICHFTCGLKSAIYSHLQDGHPDASVGGAGQMGGARGTDGPPKQSEEDDFLLPMYGMLGRMSPSPCSPAPSSPSPCDISTDGGVPGAHICEVGALFDEAEEESPSIFPLGGAPSLLAPPGPASQEELAQSAHLRTLGLRRISNSKPAHGPPRVPPLVDLPPLPRLLQGDSAPRRLCPDGLTDEDPPPADGSEERCPLCHPEDGVLRCPCCHLLRKSWKGLEKHWRRRGRRRRRMERRRRKEEESGKKRRREEENGKGGREEEEGVKKRRKGENGKTRRDRGRPQPAVEWNGHQGAIEVPSVDQEHRLPGDSGASQATPTQRWSLKGSGGGATDEPKEKPDSHRCSRCQRTFSSALTLRRHLAVHAVHKSFSCPHCPYSSRRKASLKQHLRTHTGEKPYRCSQCSYASIDRSSLLRHIRTHTQQKPYRCHLCTYSSIQKKCLDLHARRYHTGEVFRCDRCDYSNPDRQLLRRHILRNHACPEPLADADADTHADADTDDGCPGQEGAGPEGPAAVVPFDGTVGAPAL